MSDLNDRVYAAGDRLTRYYRRQHGETWDAAEVTADLAELVNRTLQPPETIEVVLRELAGWRLRP
jgi:hypothetical protein